MTYIYLKKIFYWATAGTVFGICAALGWLYAFKYFAFDTSNQEPDEIHVYIKSQEAKVGMPCIEFGEITRKYIADFISPIIELGRKGDDWLAYISDDKIKEMEKYEGKIETCSIMKKVAKTNGVEIRGDFADMWSLLSTLILHAKSYPMDKRTMRNLKPGIFKEIEQLYLKTQNTNTQK